MRAPLSRRVMKSSSRAESAPWITPVSVALTGSRWPIAPNVKMGRLSTNGVSAASITPAWWGATYPRKAESREMTASSTVSTTVICPLGQ